MASQITTHCTTLSSPLFFFGNNNMYSMLHDPACSGTGSFCVSKRRATCPTVKPRTFLLKCRAADRFPFGTLKVKSDEVTEIESEVATGTRKLQSLPGTRKLDWRKTDKNLVFVAGATGGVGSRLVRELLKLGFQVRAGVRDVAKVEALLEMAAEIKSDGEDSMPWPARLFRFRSPPQGRLEVTECDLERDQIEVALGDAGVVICVIGATEKDVLDVTGPYRIDYKATKNLIDAASAANVKHFILVTSLGTTKFGWPASILNLFWGVLIWKAKAEKTLQESQIPYTIVRPGGMERPTDAFKETHNLGLYRKDSLSGGQVSRLQVAELIACCVSNPDLSKNKVLEAIAETTVPLRPIEELLSIIPSEDGETESDAIPVEDAQPIPIPGWASKVSRREEEKKLAEKVKLEKERKRALCDKYETELSEARETEKEAKKEADIAASQKEQLEKKKKELQAQADAAVHKAQTAKALETASLNAARQGQRLSEKEKRDIVAAVSAEINSVQRVEEKEKSIKASADGKKKPAETIARLAETKTKPIVSQIGTAVKEEGGRTVEEVSKKKQLEAQAGKRKGREYGAEKEVARKEERPLQAKAKDEEKAKSFAQETEKKEEAAGRKPKEDAAKSKINEGAQGKVSAEASKRDQEVLDREAIQDAENIAKIKAFRDEAVARERLALERAKAVNFTWPWQAKTESTLPAGFARETATEDATDEAARKEEEKRREVEAVKRKADEEAQAKAPTELERKEIEAAERKANEEAAKIKAEEEVAAAAEAFERKEREAIEKNGKEDVDSIAKKKALREDVVTRERLALERAKAATSFTWPWQKNVDFVSSTESSLIQDFLTESEPQLPKRPLVNGPVSTISDMQPPPSSQSLSPYTRYLDLKPPASPTPQAPIYGKRPEAIKEDLKPLAVIEHNLQIKETQQSVEEKVALVVDPTNTENVKERARLAKEAAEEAAARAALALEKAKSVATLSWPWRREEIEGERPLAFSPSVTKNVSQSASASTNLPRPSRPLSPYTRYPDLKPPPSPTAWPPKVVKRVNPTIATTRKVECSNGGGEHKEKHKLETANPSGFKWPWQA